MTAYKKAEKLYKSARTFIISCVGEDGYPLTKAVVPGKYRESLNEIYFCTNTSSKFAGVIKNNPKASVYFYKRILLIWKGCFLKGKMEIISDLSVKEKYWQNMYKDAYPEKSYKCPDFCLLKFTGSSGRLYSNFTIEDFEVSM